jgi:transposase
MSKPYSEDLRERLVDAVKRGMSRRAAAGVFAVSAATAVRWVRIEKETGSVSHKPMGGDRRSKLAKHRGFLLKLVEQQPDLTLAEIRQRLAKRKVEAGHATLWRFFAKENITVKKNSARRRTGSPRRRPGPHNVAQKAGKTQGQQAGICR